MVRCVNVFCCWRLCLSGMCPPVENINLTFTVANHNVLVWLTATGTSSVSLLWSLLIFYSPTHILARRRLGWNWIPQNQSWRGGRPELWAFSRKYWKILMIGSGGLCWHYLHYNECIDAVFVVVCLELLAFWFSRKIHIGSGGTAPSDISPYCVCQQLWNWFKSIKDKRVEIKFESCHLLFSRWFCKGLLSILYSIRNWKIS